MKFALTTVVSHLLSALFLALVTPAALAQTAPPTLAIDSPEALAQALREAPAGTEIVLAPGDYGSLSIRGDTPVSAIRSADATAPARFRAVDIRGVDGLRIEGLVFDYVFDGADPIHIRPFSFQDSADLEIIGNVFDGALARGLGPDDDGYGYGVGLRVAHSENVSIAGNRIYDFHRGLLVQDIRGLTVHGNTVHGIRSDGMNFVQVADVRVEGNHLHDFNRSLDSPDHSDMIQFWSLRTEWPSHDIVIRGNLLDAGSGWFTQSIFMRNERSDTQGSNDPGLFYRDILIEENVIINAHLHGITVGDAIGVTIRNNTVVQTPSAATGDPSEGLYIPMIRVAEINRDVVVRGNIVGRIVGYEGQRGWQVADNLLVQNQSRLEPAHYSLVFLGGPGTDPARFRLRPDGLAADAGIGSELLRSDQSPVDLLP